MDELHHRTVAGLTDWLLDAIRKNIASHGWHGMYIGATEEMPCIPFAYTVGLREQGFPELIVFALPPHVGHSILHNTVNFMKEHGAPLDGDVAAEEEIANTRTAFRSLDPERACAEHMRFARSYYGDLPPRTMQIVWPDEDGMFPWQAGSDRDLHFRQCEIVDWRGQ